MSTTTDTELLTQREVAGLLKVSERTVFALRKSGKLKSVRPMAGSAIRFRPSHVQEYIASLVVEQK